MFEDWLNLLAGNDYDEPRLVELLKTMDIPTRDALIATAIDPTDYTPEQIRAMCTPKADKAIGDAMHRATARPRQISPVSAGALNRVAQEANTADAHALTAYVDWWHGWDRWAYVRMNDAYALNPNHSLTAIVFTLYAKNIRPDAFAARIEERNDGNE